MASAEPSPGSADGRPLLQASPQSECPICRTPMTRTQAQMDCHQCRQPFHYSCYHRHLQTSARGGCPSCRYGAIGEGTTFSSSPPPHSTAAQATTLTVNQVSPPSGPFLPIQQQMPWGAGAPFMYSPNDPIDPRLIAYRLTKCIMWCYLFFMIPSIPIYAFVTWPYTILIWTSGLLVTSFIPNRFVNPALIVHVQYLLYASLGTMVLGGVLGSVLSSDESYGLLAAYALITGFQHGFYVCAAWLLYRHGKLLRNQGLQI